MRTQFAAGRSHSERLTLYVLSRLPTEFQACQIATSKPSSLAAAQRHCGARRLDRAGIKCLIVEARSRLGGRAWTIAGPSGSSLDLGCGWLHSADRNPWVAIAEEQHRTIDKTPPPWRRRPLPNGFPEGDQGEFLKAQEEFNARLSERAQKEPDVAAATLLKPGGRWNNLISAVGTYISGAELDRVSARDFDNFDDTGVNWRIAGRLRSHDCRLRGNSSVCARVPCAADRPQRKTAQD
jgi:Monoamine oxidase